MTSTLPFLLLAALALPASAADVPASPQVARLTDSSVLVESLADLKMATCQPMKGERVQLGEQRNSIGGMPGNVAQVTVIEGRCAGKTGWVGMERPEAVR